MKSTLTPLILFVSLIVCIKSSAMDRTDDPLGRDQTLIDSSELVIVWGGPEDTTYAKVYDFFPLPVPTPSGETGEIKPKPRQSESGPWGYTGGGQVDIATANFDGEGFADIVAVWKGPNQSINVVVPEVNTFLSWNNANRLNLPDSTSSAVVDLAVGDFDADWQDEILVAYVGTDQLVHLQLLDSNGTLTPTVHGSIADELSLGTLEHGFAVATGDLDGDRDHEIVLVGIDPDWDGAGPLNDWGLYAKIYDVTRQEGTLELQPKGRTIYFKKPTSPDPRIFSVILSVTTGDFDNDTVDEIAVLTVYHDDDELSEYDDTFLQILEPDGNLETIREVSQGGDQRDLFTSNSRPGGTLVAADISLNGRDELLYSVNSRVYVFSVDEAFQEPEPQHVLTLRLREDFLATSAGSGNSDADFSHTVLEVRNMDNSDDPDGDAPEIVSVYNQHNSGVNETQKLEVSIRVIEDTSTDDWRAVERARLEDEIAPNESSRRAFAMALGDFDGDRIRVGDPTITSRTGVVSPHVVLNAPPVHFDILDNTEFDINQCFDVNPCGFTSTYEQAQTLEVGITTEFHSDWTLDVSAGAEGEFYGIRVGGSIGGTYGEGFKNVERERNSVTMRTTVKATEDDIIYASVADYNLWEYPVFADATLIGYILAVDVVWNGNVWIPSKSPETAADYRPDHEIGNILSYQEYPDSLQQNNNVASLIRGSNSESFILNDTQDFEWFLRFVDFQENSAEVSWDTKLTGTVAIAADEGEGEYNEGEISTSTNTVTEELSLKVSLGQVDLGLGNAQYRVTPYTYWDRKAGALVVDYAVRPEQSLPGEDPTWWDEHYGQKPDPGFLMRWRYDEEKGRVVSDRQKQRTNQITFTQPELIRGAITTITARVHNLSLKDMTAPVTVRFYLDDPDQGGQLIQSTTGQTEVALDPLEARGNGLAEMEWEVPPGSERFLTVYAVIDPDDQLDEIHSNNNKGWTILGINDDLTPVVLTSFDILEQVGHIVLAWTPASSSDHTAFYVWRASSSDAEYVRVTERLGPGVTKFVDNTTIPGKRYFYKLQSLDRTGQSEFFGPLSGIALDVAPQLHLAQNSPNPFAASTQIRFQIPVESRVRVKVFDINGRVVRDILDQERPVGAHEIEWDGRDELGRRVSSGLYLYQLQIPGQSRTGRMVLIR